MTSQLLFHLKHKKYADAVNTKKYCLELKIYSVLRQGWFKYLNKNLRTALLSNGNWKEHNLFEIFLRRIFLRDFEHFSKQKL